MVLILVTSLLPGGKVAAQAPGYLRAGQRIRVLMTDNVTRWTMVGRFGGVGRGGLTVFGDSANPVVVVPEAGILRVEVSRGKDPRIRYGLPLALGTVGALLGPKIFTENRTCRFRPDESECSKQTPDGAIGAAIGGVAGLLLGSLIAPERWQEMPIRWVLGARPGNGISVGLAIAF